MKIWTYLLCVVLATPLLATASTCGDIANRINTDMATHDIQNQPLPWMKLAWLKEQLGNENSKTVSNETKTYKWLSETDGSYVVAVVDDNGNVIKLSGQYNSDSGSGLFEAQIPVINIPVKTIKPAKAKIKAEPEQPQPVLIKSNLSKSDRLHDYNEHFKTSFQNIADFEDDMAKRIQLYYSSLRRCEKGTYMYALPVLNDFLYQTAVISEPREGRCQVKISYLIPQIGKIDLKCSYDAQTLQRFTDAEAEAATHSDHPATMQTAAEKQCLRYVDGVL